MRQGIFLHHCNENDMGGMDDENKPQISIQENSAALFLEITAEYDSDWQDEHSLISTKTSQIHILDEDHAELQKALDALNQKNLDSQSTFMADNQADARQMLVSVRDLKVTVLKAGSQEQEIIPSGTSFKITATDGKSFVEAKWMMDAAAAFRLSKTQTHGNGRSTVSASMNVLK